MSYSAQGALVSNQQNAPRAEVLEPSKTSNHPSNEDIPRFAAWNLDDDALPPLIKEPWKLGFDFA